MIGTKCNRMLPYSAIVRYNIGLLDQFLNPDKFLIDKVHRILIGHSNPCVS
jgi:hypothetical protein